MSPRTWSIRGWLGILIAAVALPSLVLLGVLFAAQVHRERVESREAALRIARASGGRIRVQHESAAALLRQMAQRPAVRDFDGTACDTLFGMVAVFPRWVDLLLYDANGATACSAHPAGDAALSLAAQESIAGEIRRGGLRTPGPHIRRIRGHWFSVVTQPVLRGDGSVRGLLVLLQLLDFIPAEALLPNTVVTILDRDGTVLARSMAPDSVLGLNAGNAEVVRIALREREGEAEARGIDGVSRQYGFTTLATPGWTVYAGVPTEDVMRPVRETFFLGIGGVAMILLPITFVAIVVARGIEKPVSALVRAVEAASRVGHGHADAAGGPLEIARLSAAFNEMVDRRSAADLRTQESERNLRALSERLITVQENERMRVAREIHDDLGQALTALKMDVIGLLEKSRPPADATPMVERILRTLDSTVTAVQRIASELRPSVLDDLGLFAAIEAEARLFEERSGIECELSVPDEPPGVDKTQATAIYRIVQEALTNVARHSNASRVEIRVRERAGELLLEIRDDGQGIEAGHVLDPESLGLAGIRERADMLGGTAHIEGVQGRGTIVSIRMPVAAPGEREA
jgi:signal transduction histidine kinase